MDPSVALYPNAVLGYRVWKYDLIEADSGKIKPYLMAAHVANNWNSKNVRASCIVNAEHQAPEAACRCGIHAYHRLPWAEKEAEAISRCGTIIGAIAGKGSVLCHYHGWRSEEAQILGLLSRGPGLLEIDRFLAEQYRVPLFTTSEDLTRYAQSLAILVPNELLPCRRKVLLMHFRFLGQVILNLGDRIGSSLYSLPQALRSSITRNNSY